MTTTFNNSTEATCIYLQKTKLFKVLGINLLIFFFTFLSHFYSMVPILFVCLFVSLSPQILHPLALFLSALPPVFTEHVLVSF